MLLIKRVGGRTRLQRQGIFRQLFIANADMARPRGHQPESITNLVKNIHGRSLNLECVLFHGRDLTMPVETLSRKREIRR